MELLLGEVAMGAILRIGAVDVGFCRGVWDD